MPIVRRLSEALRAEGESYWCAKDLYNGTCDGADAGGTRPACFASRWDRIVYDPVGWASFYERVYTMRQRELDYVFERLEAILGKPARLFLVGMSEGGMVVARYASPRLAEFGLAGRIVHEFSCEYTYFSSCAEHAKLAVDPSAGSERGRGDGARGEGARGEGAATSQATAPAEAAVPLLNLLSAVDPFFGSGAVPTAALGQDTRDALYAYDPTWDPQAAPYHRSTASNVSDDANGYGAKALTGQCAAAMRAQGVPGVSLTLDEPYHGGYAFMGALLNHFVASFVQNTTAMAHSGKVIDRASPHCLCL